MVGPTYSGNSLGILVASNISSAEILVTFLGMLAKGRNERLSGNCSSSSKDSIFLLGGREGISK